MMFSGRSTAGSELSYGAAVILGLLPMIGVYGEDEDNYLKHMIKRHVVGGDMLEFVKSKCSIVNIAKLMDIMNDPTVSAEDDYEYASTYAKKDGDGSGNAEDNK
jgi:hypothetical protein